VIVIDDTKVTKIVQLGSDPFCIDQARGRVASTANYELTMMYWHIGERINREVLGYKRAEYGKQIVATRNLWRLLRHDWLNEKSAKGDCPLLHFL